MNLVNIFNLFYLSVQLLSSSADEICSVRKNIINQLFNSVDYILQPTAEAVNRMCKLIVTEPYMRYYPTPIENAPISDNSTRQLLWADVFSANLTRQFNSPYGAGLAGENNFLMFYVYRRNTKTIALGYRREDQNGTLQKVNYYFSLDPITGKSIGTATPSPRPPIKNTDYHWYQDGTNNFGKMVWSVYDSVALGAIACNAVKAVNFTYNGRNVTYVSSAEFSLKFFDDYLAKYSDSYIVAYIMNTASGILYATSLNLALNATQKAVDSPDPYISSTAKYIFNSKITTNTDRYVSELGYSIQTRFYTSKDPGIQWTLVSATSDGAVVTGSNDKNDDTIDIIYDISIAVLVFVFLSFLIACYNIYNLIYNQKTTSLASRDEKASGL